ncbi:MAG: HemK family modification methylase [Microbacteriaceae bacterium]|nr:HemK family modification methylase [Microbacteriaceae bacterium]
MFADPLPSVAEVARRLRAAGCVYAEDEARLLLAAEARPDALEAMIGERIDGTPLEHILGWAAFAGLRIAVHRGVFVPRRRTELLATEAAALCPPGGTLLELCCGSGAVASAVAAQRARLTVFAVDIDPAAARCARENLGSRAGTRATVLEGDLYEPLPAGLRGRIDVIVANAPYVPTGSIDTMPAEAREHEPLVALDGGVDGLEVQRRVVGGAAPWLRPGGHLLVETSERQAPLTRSIFESHGFSAHRVRSTPLDAAVVVGMTPTGPAASEGRAAS